MISPLMIEASFIRKMSMNRGRTSLTMALIEELRPPREEMMSNTVKNLRVNLRCVKSKSMFTITSSLPEYVLLMGIIPSSSVSLHLFQMTLKTEYHSEKGTYIVSDFIFPN